MEEAPVQEQAVEVVVSLVAEVFVAKEADKAEVVEAELLREAVGLVLVVEERPLAEEQLRVSLSADEACDGERYAPEN